MSDEWQKPLIDRMNKLIADKKHLIEFDAKCRFQSLISERESEAFNSAIESMDREIQQIQFDLMLDEMLKSDLPFDEFIKRFNQ